MARARSETGAPRLALVGDETLLGREIREVLEARATGAAITAYASSGEGNFGEEEGEAVFRDPLRPESLLDEHAIVVAGSLEGASKAYKLVKAAGGNPVLIDCTGYLDGEPEARIVGPLIHESDFRLDATAGTADANWLVIVARPAAGALSVVLSRLAKHGPIRRAVAHIFEPASERGKRGVSELHEQTSSLLAFKPLKKDVFDQQLSFNLLSQYGEEAPHKLLAVERRIETHLATLLSRETKAPVPMPSLRLIQAPVFHGYSISLWAEFDSDVETAALAEALASAQIEVRGQAEEAPNSVGAAGQSGLIAGDIRVDRNNSRAAWFWIVGDNLRLTADAAADVIGMLATGMLRTEQK